MAGLLDFLSGAGGGLLSGLMYPSPLLQPQEQPQTQYDPMGNPIFMAQPNKPDPFGPVPGFNPQDFAPKSPFNVGAAPSPFTAPAFAAGPTQPQQPQQPAPPQATPQPQGVDFPQNQINVGGYQMPRVGDASNFVSQTPTDVSAQSRQPQQAPQQQGLPPALGGIGSVLGRLGNPDGLIARLTGNDSRSIAQQNLKAQYDALVPVVGQQKALLAVLNPEAGKTILAQALEKKQYGFQKLDSDTVVRTDPLTGKVDVAYGGGDTNKEGVAGPDGKIIPYPAGLDAAGRKTFANEIAKINADAAAGKKTEVQAKSEKFGNQMELAESNLKDLQGQGTSLFGQIASNVPLGNYAQSKEYQKYNQAKNKFITSLLRDESGAAIGTQEFKRYERELFPQPGDSAEVIAQKADARKAAIDSMKKAAGPGYKPPTMPSSLPQGWSVTVK